jgi:AmmeMemoRadiSam system protein A
MAARLLGADRVDVLHYANSGDVPGAPRHRVVGYCAVAVYRSPGAPNPVAQAGNVHLDAAQQRRLLSLARQTIEQHVRNGKPPELEETDPDLLRPAAAFVTLKRRGALRGCIGSLTPEAPLWETVREMAISAASRDRRFPPVAPAELGEIEIEISVLSPLRKVASPDEIEIPGHGVVVSANGRHGVYLPQVAQETGWSRDELLGHLCRDKARLPTEAWKHGAKLSVFTVQSFSSPAPE